MESGLAFEVSHLWFTAFTAVAVVVAAAACILNFVNVTRKDALGVAQDSKGAMHPMNPATLKKLISAGGGAGQIKVGGVPACCHTHPHSPSLTLIDAQHQFVFVSACYSQTAGEAFVQAGVPHVVACPWDSAVRPHAHNLQCTSHSMPLFSPTLCVLVGGLAGLGPCLYDILAQLLFGPSCGPHGAPGV